MFQVNFENGFLSLVYSLFRKAELWQKHCDILSCNKWAVLEDKCNFMSMRLNIYFPDDLVYLCSFPHWTFFSPCIPSSPSYFLWPCFISVLWCYKKAECEVKFSITYLNRNAKEPSQTKSTKNKNYRKDDSLINNCPTKKKLVVCILFWDQGLSADSPAMGWNGVFYAPMTWFEIY